MIKEDKLKIFSRKPSKRGSVLVFTLIVMFIFLIIAIGMADVSIKEIKTSSNTGKSVRAFQLADSGMEEVLKNIMAGCATVADLEDAGMSCGEPTDPDNPDYGWAVISGISADGGIYKLTFKSISDEEIGSCLSADTIKIIKSKGTYMQVTRAIEVEL